MADTLEHSIRSIYELVDDRFEVLVVDDGSTDGSIKVLERLESELDRLRYFVDPHKYYFKTRAVANENARGEYVLVELDTDDVYLHGIQDFVEIFHQIEEQVDFDPFLSGNHIHMASKSLFEKENFRNLGYGGARDLWRRLIIKGQFIGLHHRPIKQEIGYDRSGLDKVSTRFEHLVTQFRSGISPESYIVWLLSKLPEWRPNNDLSLGAIIFNLIATVPAYITAHRKGVYDDIPPEYANMKRYEQILADHKMTLSNIESYYDIEVNRSRLSEKGREIFDLDSSEVVSPRYYLNQRLKIGTTPDRTTSGSY